MTDIEFRIIRMKYTLHDYFPAYMKYLIVRQSVDERMRATQAQAHDFAINVNAPPCPVLNETCHCEHAKCTSR